MLLRCLRSIETSIRLVDLILSAKIDFERIFGSGVGRRGVWWDSIRMEIEIFFQVAEACEGYYCAFLFDFSFTLYTEISIHNFT